MPGAYLRETINRRAKTLVTLVPVFDAQRNAGHTSVRGLAEIDVLRAIAEVLDLVITEMSGPWGGMAYEDLHAAALPRLRGLSPALSDDELGEILRYLVDQLLNQKERHSFRLRYQYENEDGTLEWRENVFKLLKEEYDQAPPFGTRLQASDQAINLHLSSFAIEIEAAQAAEESLVHHFVQHGRHKEAGMAAKRALDRSLQCRQKLRQVLRAIEQHVARIDYAKDFEPVLKEARQQLEERISMEAKLLVMVEDRILLANTEDRADLVAAHDLIQRAYAQHEALAAEVLQASQRFLDETLRQRFRRLPSAILADPWSDFARPLLERPLPELDAWFRAAPWTLFGLGINRPTQLNALITLMLREPTPDEEAVDESDPDVVSSVEPERFSSEEYAAASQLLSTLSPPVRLSEALVAARDAGLSENIQRLLVLQCGLWFVGDEPGQPHVEVLDDELAEPRFYGRDLLLTR